MTRYIRNIGVLLLTLAVMPAAQHAQGGPAPAADKARSMIERFMVDIWSEGDLQTIDNLLPENFEFNLAFAKTSNRETFRNMVIANRTAFQNLTYTPLDIAVDGNKAACRWKMTAKHVGTWRNISGSNKDVTIDGITFFELDGDKILRAYVQNDVYGLMTQITSGGGRTDEETRNVALVTAYVNDILIKTDFSTFSKYAAPDFHIDRSAVPEGITGKAGLSSQMDMLYKAFPDMELKMADVVAEGNKVLVRFEGPGTQTGEFAGIPATNKKATWKGLVLYMIDNGKLTHAWAVWDDYGLLMQLKQ